MSPHMAKMQFARQLLPANAALHGVCVHVHMLAFARWFGIALGYLQALAEHMLHMALVQVHVASAGSELAGVTGRKWFLSAVNWARSLGSWAELMSWRWPEPASLPTQALKIPLRQAIPWPMTQP